MLRFLIVLCFCLRFLVHNPPAFATDPLVISPENQYGNWYNYCAFACLDTLARHHNLSKLKSITRDFAAKSQNSTVPGNGFVSDPYGVLARELMIRDIQFKRTSFQLDTTKQDKSLLLKYANRLGVLVTFRSDCPGFGPHAVLCLDYEEADPTVTIYDPNRRTRQKRQPDAKPIITITRAYFDKWWTGASIVVFPEGHSDESLYTDSNHIPASFAESQ
jgi:hypothetical protein